MTSFSSPEDFIKTAQPTATAGLRAGLGSLSAAGELATLGNWWRGLGVGGKVGVGAGLAGLLGAGALGVGGLLGGDRPGETLSYRINRGMHGLLDRIRADEQVGEQFARGVGSGAAESLVGLTRDIMTKGYETMKDTLALSPVRKKIFSVLKKEDDIIGMADNRTLMEAYHTMSNVAPQLSTDKNAVKSVLRMAATSGGGLDFTTIKGIADAEAAVSKAKHIGGVK